MECDAIQPKIRFDSKITFSSLHRTGLKVYIIQFLLNLCIHIRNVKVSTHPCSNFHLKSSDYLKSQLEKLHFLLFSLAFYFSFPFCQHYTQDKFHFIWLEANKVQSSLSTKTETSSILFYLELLENIYKVKLEIGCTIFALLKAIAIARKEVKM